MPPPLCVSAKPFVTAVKGPSSERQSPAEHGLHVLSSDRLCHSHPQQAGPARHPAPSLPQTRGNPLTHGSQPQKHSGQIALHTHKKKSSPKRGTFDFVVVWTAAHVDDLWPLFSLSVCSYGRVWYLPVSLGPHKSEYYTFSMLRIQKTLLWNLLQSLSPSQYQAFHPASLSHPASGYNSSFKWDSFCFN